jgi:hypothetical protein
MRRVLVLGFFVFVAFIGWWNIVRFSEPEEWDRADQAKTLTAYRTYLQANPEGQHVDRAKKLIASLQADERPYREALAKGSVAAYNQFLKDFPGHSGEQQIQAAITDAAPQEVVDLMQAGKVAVETEGSGIESVELRLRRNTDHLLSVHVPAETFFLSRDTSSQNMVSTEEKEVELAGNERTTVEIAAACANRPLDVPGNDDRFSIVRAPQQEALRKLMPVLARAGVPYEVRQAAVWILTDNADYDALGANEEEAARAMQICEEAGIDITHMTIWQDRSRILKGLSDM